MLHLKDIVVNYGGVKALKGISMEIPKGSITCLIGANGAGKSTTLRAISGMVPLAGGEIRFEGRRIDGMEPQEIVELGISHVPEGKKLFLEMSVRDNLMAGAHLRKRKSRIDADLKRVCRFFPVLERAINRPASNMSGGEQQMLAIGRGLMSSPQLLLLDEPSLGLSPLLTKEVGGIIKKIANEGVSVLLIEQNASLALGLAEKCYVLETGTITVEGTSAELQNDDHIRAAYLGLNAESSATADKAEATSAKQKEDASQRVAAPSVEPEQKSLLPRILRPEDPCEEQCEHDQCLKICRQRRLDEVQLNLISPSTYDGGNRRRQSAKRRPAPKTISPGAPRLGETASTVAYRPASSNRAAKRIVKRVFKPASDIDQ